MDEFRFQNRAEARQWVREFQKELKRPCVIQLCGGLGAGKTQFVRWFLEDLGVIGAASPTFAIHNQYGSPSGAVDHVDLYRINSDSDLEASGFWDLLRQDRLLLFIEWADRLPDDIYPPQWMRVKMEILREDGEGRRVLCSVTRPTGPR